MVAGAEMMRIAFNALSVTNLSGRHVFLGHAREVVAASSGQTRHVLLYHRANRDLLASLGNVMDCVECPAATARWPIRWLWERLRLPLVLRQLGVEVVFSPAGLTIPGLPVPQLVLAQNPWCMVREIHEGKIDQVKAWLQRGAYRNTQRQAALMLYNSQYMRRIYRENAGFEPRRSAILHQGLEEDTYIAAKAPFGFFDRRCEILTVSAMARHKAVEDVVAAVARLQQRGVDVSLTLVGPWPDLAYRTEIEHLVKKLGLDEKVSILGYVSREELYQRFAQARVFCLLSRCESFGIPAIEAQAFGTPSVVADCGAPPEIAGPGGVVVAPGDIEAATDALTELLTDGVQWAHYSKNALQNASRFQWKSCSAPLVDAISQHQARVL